MKLQMRTLGIVALTWLAGMAYGAAPMGSANVGQEDLEAWPCPISTFANPTFSEMPLDFALTTTGGPVLLSVSLNTTSASSNAEVAVRFSLDGQAISAPVMRWRSELQRQGSLTRVVSVSAGMHTFGVQIACITAGDTETVTGAWLTAYELPLIRK